MFTVPIYPHNSIPVKFFALYTCCVQVFDGVRVVRFFQQLVFTWALPVTYHSHPSLYFIFLIDCAFVFKDERSCDSDDGIPPGGSRGRSSSKISQSSRTECEDHPGNQYDRRCKGSNESVAQEVKILTSINVSIKYLLKRIMDLTIARFKG